MKKRIVILFSAIVILIILGLFSLIFILPAWFVRQIDGNARTHNVTLSIHNKIYLDTRFYDILKEIAPDLNEVLVKDEVDSLCWNDSLIIGFSNGKYFRIKSSEKSLDSGCIKADENKGNFHIFYMKPGLFGFRIKDTIYE